MNWQIRIIAKIILSRFPVPYELWAWLGLFKHGEMSNVDYAEKIFNLHFSNFLKERQPKSFSLLELGPGDSLLTGLFSYIQGSSHTWLIDTGDFIDNDPKFYQRIINSRTTDINFCTRRFHFSDIEDMCQQLNITYLTNGLKSLETLQDEQIDFIFSHSVLEHVKKNELKELIQQLYRIQSRGGYSSHNIDYQDHLGGGINNLRFSNATWESSIFSNSGFYTNRVNAHEMHQLFKKAGFTIKSENFGNWKNRKLDLSIVHPDLQKKNLSKKLFPTSSILLFKK